MRLVLEEVESQESGEEELEVRETRCGWASLDKLGLVDLGDFPDSYSVS